MKKLFFGLLLFFSFFVWTKGDAQEIPMKKCIPSTVNRVHEILTNYPQYKIWDDELYVIPATNERVPLIDMILSRTEKDFSRDDARIYILMKPLQVFDKDLFPRFTMHCKVEWEGADKFIQSCDLDDGYIFPSTGKAYSRFGLAKFSIHVEVAEAQIANNSACKQGVFLRSTVSYESNSADMQKLSPLLKLVQGEAYFYQSYFNGLYELLLKKMISK